ncbi:MAG: divergent polysaccharide deacetylase family protein [Thermodesulfobacteriota bacterium]
MPAKTGKETPRSAGRPPRRRSPRRPPPRRSLWILALALAALLGLTLAAAVHVIFLRPPTAPPEVAPAPPPVPAPELAPQPAEAPAAGPSQAPPASIIPQPADLRPVVAIVIDDLGYQLAEGRSWAAVAAPLTLAFLPHAPHTRELAELAHEAGKEIFLHLPLEADDPARQPGPGGLFRRMPPEEISRLLAEDLATVPHAIGVNNHMGSAFTRSPAALAPLFAVLAARRLLFVDSLTSPASQAYPLARQAGILAGRRDLFLDNDHAPQAVASQLRALMALAERNGRALAIGHSRAETRQALAALLPELQARLRLVAISRYLGDLQAAAPPAAVP